MRCRLDSVNRSSDDNIEGQTITRKVQKVSTRSKGDTDIVASDITSYHR